MSRMDAPQPLAGTWRDAIDAIDAFDGCAFDRRLVDAFERLGRPARRPLRAATPSFQTFSSDDLSGCCKSAFPVFSITGPACALMCAHCRAEILRPMIPALTPQDLETKVRALAARGDLRGFLLSGGSNARNEIAYERFYPALERLKREMPGLRIAIHSALVDRTRARRMADAGVDTAMLDIIGSDETIRTVYHLDRPVADFAASLAALCETDMEVVPHIVIGLDHGRIAGERTALSICASHRIAGLVLVVIDAVHARPGTFATPTPTEIAALFGDARALLPDTAINLGCARPHGLHRRSVDAYAVMAGLDAIAFPSEGVIQLARAIGRPLVTSQMCCAMRRGDRSERVMP